MEEPDRDKTVSRAQAAWALSERIAALPAGLPGAWDFRFAGNEVQFAVTLASGGELAAWVRALRRLPGVTAGRRWLTPDRRHTVHPFRWGGAALCLAVPTAPDRARGETSDVPPVWAAYIETLDFDAEGETP